jgi:hypothetical protein
MNFILAVSLFLTATGIAAQGIEEEAPQQLLRQAAANLPESLTTSEHARSLLFTNLLDPCSLITNQFPSGQVTCDCNLALLKGSLDYTCSWASEICVGGTTGVCGTPVYTGSINAFQLSVTNEICVSGLSAIGGVLTVGDLCIDLDVNARSSKILSCSAQLGPIACASCLPCPGGGLSLNCGNVLGGAASNCTSTPVRTVTSLQSTTKIQPFLPAFKL